MKKIILAILIVTSVNAQTTIDLSGMTQNVTLGSNCSSSQTVQEYVTTGDCNLNGFRINLRNVRLKIVGNLNGGGRIEACGQAKFCVVGCIQNNPQYNPEDILCNTLALPTFKYFKHLADGLSYSVFDVNGRVLQRGKTGDGQELPKNSLIFLQVEKYQTKKLYIQ